MRIKGFKTRISLVQIIRVIMAEYAFKKYSKPISMSLYKFRLSKYVEANKKFLKYFLKNVETSFLLKILVRLPSLLAFFISKDCKTRPLTYLLNALYLEDSASRFVRKNDFEAKVFNLRAGYCSGMNDIASKYPKSAFYDFGVDGVISLREEILRIDPENNCFPKILDNYFFDVRDFSKGKFGNLIDAKIPSLFFADGLFSYLDREILKKMINIFLSSNKKNEVIFNISVNGCLNIKSITNFEKFFKIDMKNISSGVYKGDFGNVEELEEFLQKLEFSYEILKPEELYKKYLNGDFSIGDLDDPKTEDFHFVRVFNS